MRMILAVLLVDVGALSCSAPTLVGASLEDVIPGACDRAQSCCMRCPSGSTCARWELADGGLSEAACAFACIDGFARARCSALDGSCIDEREHNEPMCRFEGEE